MVYAVEFSHRSGRDLLNVAKKRTNIIPIIEDARHPHKYRMLVGKPEVDFSALVMHVFNVPLRLIAPTKSEGTTIYLSKA